MSKAKYIMQYKTIVLELLKQQPELYQKLVASNSLLLTMSQYAVQFRDNHLAIVEHLWELRPGTSELQVRSEAMEIATQALQDSILNMQDSNESAPLSLDAAMAFLRRHTRHD